MKNTVLTLIFICLFLPAFAQDTLSVTVTTPVKSPIKSLTAQEYNDIRTGAEMGMGRVAELNGYPSPHEVNKLDEKLALTPNQREQLKIVIDWWKFKTGEMGRFILAEEAKLNTLFSSGKATDGAVIYYTNKIGLYLGELRNAHLQAHLKTRNILTREQIKKYNQFKGYSN